MCMRRIMMWAVVFRWHDLRSFHESLSMSVTNGLPGIRVAMEARGRRRIICALRLRQEWVVLDDDDGGGEDQRR